MMFNGQRQAETNKQMMLNGQREPEINKQTTKLATSALNKHTNE